MESSAGDIKRREDVKRETWKEVKRGQIIGHLRKGVVLEKSGNDPMIKKEKGRKEWEGGGKKRQVHGIRVPSSLKKLGGVRTQRKRGVKGQDRGREGRVQRRKSLGNKKRNS